MNFLKQLFKKEKTTMAIQLGSKVKHKITGFTGIAVGHCKYLTGCDQFLIKSQELKDGMPLDGCWFDEMMIDVLEEPTVSTLPNAAPNKGGPQRDAPRSR